MQIAAQSTFDQSGLTNDAATGQIAFSGQVYVPAGANASTEPAGDFVITQINVRAAGRADCRRRCARNLLFPFTFETLDNATGLPLPKILKFPKDG